MSKLKGILFAAFAAICYGLNPCFGIPLYEVGIHPFSVLFYRFLLAALLLGAFMLVAGKSFVLAKKYIPGTAVAGILMALTCLFWFLSFEIMDSGIASAILFVYPVMVALIMWLFYHEKPSLATAVGIILAIAGVSLLCGVGGNVCVTGVVYIMLSALAYAIYIVMVKVTNLKELAPETLTFYAMLFSVVIFLIPLRMGADLQMLASPAEWAYAAGLALFPSLCAFLFTAIAIREIGAVKSAVMGALEPVTAVLVGVMIFNESIKFTGFLAIALIIAAVTIVVGGKSEMSITEKRVSNGNAN